MSFTGGKMLHPLRIDRSGYPYKYDTQEISEEAMKIFNEGDIFVKIDGSNGALKVVEGCVKVYRRHDYRNKGIPDDEHILPLPEGGNPFTYEDHSYAYDEVYVHAKMGKKMKRLHQTMLDLVTKHEDTLKRKLAKFPNQFCTIEWVGRKFGNTPGCSFDVGFVIHDECKLPKQYTTEPYTRSLEDLFKICEELVIEGLVFRHNGKYYKLLSSLYEPGCKFDQYRGRKGDRPTNYEHPKIYQ